MRLAIVLLLLGAFALAVGHACGVPWRDIGVALGLVVTAVLLGPEPRRAP